MVHFTVSMNILILGSEFNLTVDALPLCNVALHNTVASYPLAPYVEQWQISTSGGNL